MKRTTRMLVMLAVTFCWFGAEPVAAQWWNCDAVSWQEFNSEYLPLAKGTVEQRSQFAWMTFVRINQPEKPGSTDRLWESWITNPELYPAGGAKPQWPSGERVRRLQPSVKLRHAKASGGQVAQGVGTGGEERTHNFPEYEYLLKNKLYNKQGLAAAYANKLKIDVPIESVEIKANWWEASPGDEASYMTHKGSDGKLYKLVGMHISSKAVKPDWFWCTFEHKDNPDRPEIYPYLTSKDAFGITQPPTPSSPPSGALQAMFRQAGLTKAFWSNYRLNGTQIYYTVDNNPNGKGTVMGNSTMEGFIPVQGNWNSSCINCHKQARFDRNGNTPDGLFTEEIGRPNPSWFNGYQSADFIWSIFIAQ